MKDEAAGKFILQPSSFILWFGRRLQRMLLSLHTRLTEEIVPKVLLCRQLLETNDAAVFAGAFCQLPRGGVVLHSGVLARMERMKDEVDTILHPSSFILHPSSFIPHPSSFILHPSSLILHPTPR
jgi:hypothetical protein